MRTRWRTGLLVTTTVVLVGAGIAPAQAATPETGPTTWTADLAAGEASGVTVDGGEVRLVDGGAFTAPPETGATTEGSRTSAGDRDTTGGDPDEGWDPDKGWNGGEDPNTREYWDAEDRDSEGAADPVAVPTGLLTLEPEELDRPAGRVTSVVDGDLPAGTTASVDVRGRRATGSWTEWVPATTTAPGTGTVTLPEPTREVQGRLVLTGTPEGEAPAVQAVTLTAAPAGVAEGGPDLAEAAPVTANVFATREGLVGGTTANGHVITERDHFVALPSRRGLSPRDTSDYSVRVCAPNGKCAFAPVWDVGPWNTRDDYWNPPDLRREWKDLPQGVPQAQAAYRDGYNGGNDQFGRKVLNPAGIDLADGVFWDALGLKNNSQVQVDYLWTGSLTLSEVRTTGTDGIAQVRSAPSLTAAVVGLAANTAGVPVRCAAGDWLQIGVGQYLSASVLPAATGVAACP